MAHVDWIGRLRCSYKRATFVVCTGNLVVALYMLHAALSPLYFDSSSSSSSAPPGNVIFPMGGLEPEVAYTKAELERIEASNQLRRELLPVQLIERVKEIQAETEMEISKSKSWNEKRQKVASELAQRLRELKLSNSQSSQQALEEWKKKKLQEVKKREGAEPKGHDEEQVALDPGAQLPSDENATGDQDSGGLLTNALDMEHEVIPGRPLPPECRAEAHTDYAGAAVRWGLTFHVETAADCCQACLAQAKYAKDGEKRCNIWVYCPEPDGCYSPDKFKHKNRECWLKQADEPEINFKGHYDEEFRQEHANVPVIVPWVSGVTS